MDLTPIKNWPVNEWEGHACRQGEVNGRPCRIALPAHGCCPDARWFWRAEFFGIFADTDLELLERGHVLVYMDVQNMYGAPIAMRHFAAMYSFTRKLALHPRAALIGLSCGGLAVYNWAIDHPETVACIYADAPVCDIRSWPCRAGRLDTYPQNRERCLASYGLTTATLMSSAYSPPATRVGELARAGIPIIHVVGEDDDVVPVMENSIPLLSAFLQAGGNCRYISKPACGHHPHGLQNPIEVADFIDRAFDRWNAQTPLR